MFVTREWHEGFEVLRIHFDDATDAEVDATVCTSFVTGATRGARQATRFGRIVDVVRLIVEVVGLVVEVNGHDVELRLHVASRFTAAATSSRRAGIHLRAISEADGTSATLIGALVEVDRRVATRFVSVVTLLVPFVEVDVSVVIRRGLDHGAATTSFGGSMLDEGDVVERLGGDVNVKVTYKDYLEFPDDGQRYEVIDGNVIVTPSPSMGHQHVSARLGWIVMNHVRTHDLGEVYFAPCDVLFSDETIVQPDLLYVAKTRMKIVGRSYVGGAPDLAVEILSPSTATRDRSLKLQTYQSYGVLHHWILDPERRELEEYVLVDGKFQLVSKLAGPVAFAPKAFPGLTVDLSLVWPT